MEKETYTLSPRLGGNYYHYATRHEAVGAKAILERRAKERERTGRMLEKWGPKQYEDTWSIKMTSNRPVHSNQ